MYICKILLADNVGISNGRLYFSSNLERLKQLSEKTIKLYGVYSVSIYKYNPSDDIEDFADLNEDF